MHVHIWLRASPAAVSVASEATQTLQNDITTLTRQWIVGKCRLSKSAGRRTWPRQATRSMMKQGQKQFYKMFYQISKMANKKTNQSHVQNDRLAFWHQGMSRQQLKPTTFASTKRKKLKSGTPGRWWKQDLKGLRINMFQIHWCCCHCKSFFGSKM